MQKRHHFRLSSSRRPGGTEGVEFREPFMRSFAPLFCLYLERPTTIRFEPFFLAALATGFLRYATMTRIGEA